jgi:hypothetical protein
MTRSVHRILLGQNRVRWVGHYRGEESCLHGFGGEARRKEAAWKVGR